MREEPSSSRALNLNLNLNLMGGGRHYLNHAVIVSPTQTDLYLLNYYNISNLADELDRSNPCSDSGLLVYLFSQPKS